MLSGLVLFIYTGSLINFCNACSFSRVEEISTLKEILFRLTYFANDFIYKRLESKRCFIVVLSVLITETVGSSYRIITITDT